VEVGVQQVAGITADGPEPIRVGRAGLAVAVEDLRVVGEVADADAGRLDSAAFAVRDGQQLVVKGRVSRAVDVAGGGERARVGLVRGGVQVGEAVQDQTGVVPALVDRDGIFSEQLGDVVDAPPGAIFDVGPSVGDVRTFVAGHMFAELPVDRLEYPLDLRF